ncbi:hypothetical protein DICVIV_08510 [Dictyocaulus viviparus]|uniref:Uncharacterized protein n=1 Tax=Dictyocaulus viviparus TaxID=29172 RepID=A0A0D8XSS7_DICVI|nr:hypothetical protein DICVIV_08510 [Dictyocaulus viviparus]
MIYMGVVQPQISYCDYLHFEVVEMRKVCPLMGPKMSAFWCGKCSLYLRDIENKYSEKAMQCWIAAGMYGVTLILLEDPIFIDRQGLIKYQKFQHERSRGS